jgi:hypothetical protein
MIYPALAGHLLGKMYYFVFKKSNFTYTITYKKKKVDGTLIELKESHQVVKTVALEPI